MGTKNNPSPFDCYSKAEPDEPYFVLLGRDPTATYLVEMWTMLRGETISKEKLAEARKCADDMKKWATEHAPLEGPLPNDFIDALFHDIAEAFVKQWNKRFGGGEEINPSCGKVGCTVVGVHEHPTEG